MSLPTPQEIAFINRFQGSFPLVERPYQAMAEEIGLDETSLIELIDQLLVKGILTRFGPSFDASRLDGELTLAALTAPEARYDQIADIVNLIPQVAHNYRRDHDLNMWFVISSLEKGGVARCIDEIEQATELKVYNFPKQREFYLGLWLHLHQDGRIDTIPAPFIPAADSGGALNELDRAIINETQGGMPLEPRPFDQLARRLEAPAEAVIDRMHYMLGNGSIRRIGAFPNHYRLGLRGNGMTVWDVPDEHVEEVGRRLGELDYVSHCYERVRYPDIWAYNLFAMVHGRDRAEAAAKAEKIAELLGDHCRSYDILYSSAVLKKTGLRTAA